MGLHRFRFALLPHQGMEAVHSGVIYGVVVVVVVVVVMVVVVVVTSS